MSARRNHRVRRPFFVAGFGLALIGVFAACAGGSSASDETPPDEGGQAGSGNAAGSGGGSAGTGGGVGGKGGSSGSSGGTAGSAGTAGSSGTAGAAGASGTAGAAGASGTAGASGSGGKGGASGAGGMSGSGGTAGAAGTSGGGGASGTAGAAGAAGASGSAGKAGSGGGCASVEKCNGLDDTCDGNIDENDPEGGAACDVPGKLGECQKGVMHCVAGALKCVQVNTQKAEICNGKDDNCDGAVDNPPFDTAIKPTPGDACETGKAGICKPGTQTCEGGTVVCKQDNQPLPNEICNGQDDNCDGQVDEGSPGANQACIVDAFKFTAPGSPCAQGKTGCGAGGQISCIQQTQPKFETCNGVDDDCDGSIDNGLNGTDCTSSAAGVCAAGILSCTGGTPTCTPKITPGSQAESCDGKDNDCNGQVDDGNPTFLCGVNYPLATNVQTWSCGASKCTLAQCKSGYADIDGAPGNGCECQSDAWATQCGLTGSGIGVSGSPSNQSGVVETATGSDWIRFNFTNPGAPNAYHPKVELTNTAGGQYAMDVFTGDCSTAASCTTKTGSNESGLGVSAWEQAYGVNSGASGYNASCSSAGNCNDKTSRITTVYVRIYRKNGDSPTCSPYTVTASSN